MLFLTPLVPLSWDLVSTPPSSLHNQYTAAPAFSYYCIFTTKIPETTRERGKLRVLHTHLPVALAVVAEGVLGMLAHSRCQAVLISVSAPLLSGNSFALGQAGAPG